MHNTRTWTLISMITCLIILRLFVRFAVPSPPSGIEALCLVVIWKPPLQPNGAITQYEIEFSSPQQVTLTEFEPPDSNYILVPSGYDRVRVRLIIKVTPYSTYLSVHEISEIDCFKCTTQIRARTAVGPGEWTHIKPIGEPLSCSPVLCTRVTLVHNYEAFNWIFLGQNCIHPITWFSS